MKRIKSISNKRLIVEAKVSGKNAFFLIDTGACVGLINSNQRKRYYLKVGKSYAGTLIGVGGSMRNVKHCDSFVYIGDRAIPQFLLADISDVAKSIEKETGIEILGIISLPQMKMCGLGIDANDMEIIVE